MTRRLIARIFRRPKTPLAVHMLAWTSLLGVKVLALGINATTSSGGRYGL